METTNNPIMPFPTSHKATEGTSRIECFSDGVFAIAITLLVLDIHVPVVKGNESMLKALAANWQVYLAFLIGFFTLLVCWINHHYMFELICKRNDVLLLLNGFKLLVVSFTPFATALLADYIATPNQQIPISIYGFNFFLMGTAMTSLWLYANKKGLTKADSPGILKATTKFFVFASILSGVIFLISFISIPVSLVLFGIMFLIFVFPKDRVNRLVEFEKRKNGNLYHTIIETISPAEEEVIAQ
ncbi:MAG TPA: TMEM175 family protein [Parafilimonas sp.]